MKPPRSCKKTLDIPITLVRGQYTWSAVFAVRMSPRTGWPRCTDIYDVQRLSWGTSYQFDLLDSDWTAILEMVGLAKKAYLESTVEPTEERAP